MNLHQAKGLQAQVVILASPYKSSRKKSAQIHIERSQEKDCNQTNNPTPKGYFKFTFTGSYGPQVLIPVSDWDKKFNEEEKYLKAEENRLLYVAATRAKELLIIADYDEKKENGYWYELIKKLKSLDNESLWHVRLICRATMVAA